ncbi:1-aminocyclopropane-1-carboxylate deaminase/D-cysteine desulfhydrase [Bowmanella yangjiangensis]|uniref:1-aminocyclopropane-1-carboxylate deaminase/D-cysteine desulfhydrase n=1 Tax=Bowmanella yangjiangensis TaxID=2811230 RepID=UPI002FCD7CC5
MPDSSFCAEEISASLNINTPSPVQPLCVDWPGSEQVELFIKRDDLIHPIISGNKWRKLKYALLEARQKGVAEIISFGGGHSNHLHALGYCCQQLGIQLMALVRGDYSQNPTPMLRDLYQWQAQIIYLDKATYQQRSQSDFIGAWQAAHPNAMIVPEGGSQAQALPGVAEILQEQEQKFSHIIVPVGSGGTLAGLIQARQIQHQDNTQLLGIAALKGEGYLEELVTNLLPQSAPTNWHIEHRFHFGGYAKSTAELHTFCQTFRSHTGIGIEPVYSGKACWALKQKLAEGYFPQGSRVLLIHTGGLQGARQ